MSDNKSNHHVRIWETSKNHFLLGTNFAKTQNRVKILLHKKEETFCQDVTVLQHSTAEAHTERERHPAKRMGMTRQWVIANRKIS